MKIPNPRKCVLKLLLTSFFALGLSNQIWAESVSSTPYYANSELRIPRIDIEGFGSLDLSLALHDLDNLTFSLSSAVDASSDAMPSASFDLVTLVLTIPEIKVDANYYSLSMQLIPGDLFQLTLAEDIAVPGLVAYQSLCVTCHGNDGLGGTSNQSLFDCSQCANINMLSEYIAANMPLAGSANCVDECAVDTANYIINEINIGNNSIPTQDP
ncbi:MAG: hypothetical protein COC19_04040 [SAR86 cluster bacterium]|uniref:Cytochrome c domain-containing protein n=1 Tax=SAR86 cluster bacterium TaxID=2030880 RepID=A0A2A4MPJ4_9GAMM|nr:MAG: hypothetical protein COC19_04040 [SAR86 cluster bacterium]